MTSRLAGTRGTGHENIVPFEPAYIEENGIRPPVLPEIRS
jgi:hypothetical protein